MALVAACAVACAGPGLAVAATPAASLQILTVDVTAGRQVTLVADVQPVGATPVASEAFTVTAGGTVLPTRVEPMLSDQLAVGMVVDGSAHGVAERRTGVSGPAAFLLQLPVDARVAAVADTSPPEVVAPLAAGAKDALGALEGLRPAGERDTAAALALALRQLPAAPGEPRLVLLYTGAADAGGAAVADLGARFRTAHAPLVVVSTATDTGYWSRVTADTGGILVTPRATEPVGAFETAVDLLRGRYLLTFPAPGRLPAGVRVRVATAAGTVSAGAMVAGGRAVGDPCPQPCTDPGQGSGTHPGQGSARERGQRGVLGLPPAVLGLAAALLVLLGAAVLGRAGSAARSRSAGRVPAGDGPGRPGGGWPLPVAGSPPLRVSPPVRKLS